MRRVRNGFSLVELLIAFAILTILIVAFLMTINPIAQVNKAHDAQRKKDIKKISASFEEYFNDKGCYPKQVLIDSFNVLSNCGKNPLEFVSWLKPWPCDPNKKPYQIGTGPTNEACPKWYKVLTKLDNMSDGDIPLKFKKQIVEGAYPFTYNFGVSSTNINWYEAGVCKREFSGTAPFSQLCYEVSEETDTCVNLSESCDGDNCFVDGGCHMDCQVDKCPE